MPTITSERPVASPANTGAPSTPSPSQPVAAKIADRKVILVGFDLGTNKSCVLACAAGSGDIAVSKVVPSVVGYVKDGIVDGIISGNSRILFGDQAIQSALHATVIPPLAEGVVAHMAAARDFLRHIRSLADPSGLAEIRAVIGVPANADESSRENIRQAAMGAFDRIILIPEPFLSALGYRDESRVGQPGYVDPVTNSLFVDIGGGTSDLCLVQGYFPNADDQISIRFAGDAIDSIIETELNRTYPNNGLSRTKIREIKEAHSYVGPIRKPIDVRVILAGKAHVLELGDVLGRSANSLVDRIYPALVTLISRASSDSVVTLLQNIVITGGGSQLKGIDTVLQQRLADDGYESPRVKLAGQDYKRYVALGSLKAARSARENQWQVLLR
ncbi:MAG: rod shape-determining protein [Opitutaceae bacterium]|nr:rod shape-determining protein [Opitutaceae bacterium]